MPAPAGRLCGKYVIILSPRWGLTNMISTFYRHYRPAGADFMANMSYFEAFFLSLTAMVSPPSPKLLFTTKRPACVFSPRRKGIPQCALTDIPFPQLTTAQNSMARIGGLRWNCARVGRGIVVQKHRAVRFLRGEKHHRRAA